MRKGRGRSTGQKADKRQDWKLTKTKRENPREKVWRHEGTDDQGWQRWERGGKDGRETDADGQVGVQ